MSLGIVVDAVVALGGVGVLAVTGLALSAGSRTLLRDVMGDSRLADAVADLVTLGFLLLDAGVAALIASAGVDGGTPGALVQSVLARVGWLLVAVAGTHLLALCVVSGIRGGVHNRRARDIRDAAWETWNEEMRRRHQHAAR